MKSSLEELFRLCSIVGLIAYFCNQHDINQMDRKKFNLCEIAAKNAYIRVSSRTFAWFYYNFMHVLFQADGKLKYVV